MKVRRFWLIAPWAVFVLLAAGWVAYWHILAAGAEARVRGWIAEQETGGAQVSVGRIVRHGFPVLLRLELRDVAYAPAEAGWRAESQRLDLHIEPLNAEHLIAEAKAPIAVRRADGSVTNILADTLIASWRSENGAFAQAGIEADNLVLDDPDEEGVLAAQKLVVNVRPDPRATGQHQLAFDAQTVTLPRPVRSFEAFGLDVPRLRAAVVVEHGAKLLDAATGDPLGPWREAGGRLRFEAVEASWGPLLTTGQGWGALDDERRLTGALTLPIERPAALFSAIANGPNVSADARRALALLSAAYARGGELTLDVEAAGGVLRLEGLSVRELDAVY